MNNNLLLPLELEFIQQLVKYRIGLQQGEAIDEPVFPQPDSWQLNLLGFARQHQLKAEEIILLWIALAPHVKPGLFDETIQDMLKDSTDMPSIGGVRGKNFRGFIPTGETALFLLAGENFQRRFQLQQFFEADHMFVKKRVLWLEDVPAGEPIMSGKLILSQEYVELFTAGKISRPHFSSSFPARLITTNWNGRSCIKRRGDAKCKRTGTMATAFRCIDERMGHAKRAEKRLPVLFHGPAGTGKNTNRQSSWELYEPRCVQELISP
jgi:hypothetical protein